MSANNKDLVLQHKRKMFLLMPVIVVPLLALLFSIMGGGNASAQETDVARNDKSTDFPSGSIKESGSGKLQIAEETRQDERNAMKTDFDLTSMALEERHDTIVNNRPKDAATLNAQKLQQINAAYEGLYSGGPAPTSELYNNQPAPAPSAPARRQQPNYSQAPAPTYRDPGSGGRKSNFSYADDKGSSGSSQQGGGQRGVRSLFKAVVHGEQTIRPGSQVKLRLLDDVQLPNVLVPKNTLVYGKAMGSGSERINIKIYSISVNGQIYEVKWSVFDVDGNEGINVPGSGQDRKDVQNQTVQDGANEAQNGATNAIGDNQVAQSANRVAGNLFRNRSAKKNTLKVFFNSGYQVIIRTEED